MTEPLERAQPTGLLRAVIWVAIGALIAAAVVCVVWVFVGSQNGIVGRAFLTILLLVAFSGVTILDVHLSRRRPQWFAIASMVGWIVLLLIGAVMIWMPERFFYSGLTRTVNFLLIVLIVQLVLLHVRLFARAVLRHPTVFNRIVGIVTVALVVTLAVLLIVPLMFSEWMRFTDLYWRFVVAAAILAAVGTAIVPLVNLLFAPRRPRPVPAAGEQATLLPWPTFVDGVTPLPIMPDGSPDWGAYYTGYPSEGAHIVGVPSAPVEPPAVGRGYEGFPPPPPLPPRA